MSPFDSTRGGPDSAPTLVTVHPERRTAPRASAGSMRVPIVVLVSSGGWPGDYRSEALGRARILWRRRPERFASDPGLATACRRAFGRPARPADASPHGPARGSRPLPLDLPVGRAPRLAARPGRAPARLPRAPPGGVPLPRGRHRRRRGRARRGALAALAPRRARAPPPHGDGGYPRALHAGEPRPALRRAVGHERDARDRARDRAHDRRRPAPARDPRRRLRRRAQEAPLAGEDRRRARPGSGARLRGARAPAHAATQAPGGLAEGARQALARLHGPLRALGPDRRAQARRRRHHLRSRALGGLAHGRRTLLRQQRRLGRLCDGTGRAPGRTHRARELGSGRVSQQNRGERRTRRNAERTWVLRGFEYRGLATPEATHLLRAP